MNRKILRIIDANINRLMEGLRVVEEIARFILDDKNLTNRIKSLRIKVKEGIALLNAGDDLLKNRDSGLDVGKNLYPSSEASRNNIGQIITSNIGRCEESSRVIEEFGKMIDQRVGKVFKEIRFELYDIEKRLAEKIKLIDIKNKLDFDLYVATDPDVSKGRSPVSIIKDAIKGGIKIIQLRDKKATTGQYYKWAKEISSVCKKAGVTFIVNDYIDICIAVDADGIHLGQDDVPVEVARKLLGVDKIIGLSTHSYEQAIRGAKSGADYISVGPVFTTPSKPGVKPLGVELLKKIVEAKQCLVRTNNLIPIVAIGGINENNLKDVIRAGAKRAAVIRAVVGADNIAAAVKRLRRMF